MLPYDGPLLAATGLTRAFGSTRVLRGIDLALGAGETLAVVGPNGAGKTTLLRILAGLMRPTTGKVLVLGRRLDPSDPECRRPIGLLSHQSLLYDDLTLLENLTLVARLYGLSAPRELARAALEEVGLSACVAASPRRLSRGMVQRAAIARALLHGPAIVLLDEPFTGLDAPASERFRALLTARVTAGSAVVVVTHHLTEVWELATHVAVLAGGRWATLEPRSGELTAFLPRYHELIGA